MAMSIEEVIGQSQHRGVFAWLASRQTFWIFVAAAIACILLSLASDVFATERNLFNVTRNFAFVGIIALGMTAVIGSGGIDLSVGSIVVLSGIVVGATMAAGYPIYIAVPFAIVRRTLRRPRQRRPHRLRGHAAVRRDARHARDRAQPRDGVFRQQDDLPVRARPQPAARARRRQHVRHRQSRLSSSWRSRS